MTLFYFINHYKEDSYYNMASLFYNSGDSTLLNYLQLGLTQHSFRNEWVGFIPRYKTEGECSERHDKSPGRAKPSGKHSLKEAMIRGLGLFCGPGGGELRVSQG